MSDAEKLMERLTVMFETAKAEGRGLDMLDLVLARDAVEINEILMEAIACHRKRTIWLVSRGYRPRDGDNALYVAAGLEPVDDRLGLIGD